MDARIYLNGCISWRRHSPYRPPRYCGKLRLFAAGPAVGGVSYVMQTDWQRVLVLTLPIPSPAWATQNFGEHVPATPSLLQGATIMATPLASGDVHHATGNILKQ